MIIVREVECKNILIRSGISGYDYSINPYIGCEHNCQYCYAIFIKKFRNIKERWGEFVEVKINAPKKLKREIKNIKNAKINIGTVCDPYQPLENKYKVTRECLEILVETNTYVSILTKSDLILRNLDILKKKKDIEIGFSFTILDYNIQKLFEPKAPDVKERFNALKILSNEGIKTWVFVAPILPGFSDNFENLEKIFTYSKSSGIRKILFDSLNLYPSVYSNLRIIYFKYFKYSIKFLHYYKSRKKSYLDELKKKIIELSKLYNIDIEFCF